MILTNGGRVLAITGTGKNLEEASEQVYEGASKICWEDLYFRKDIGLDLMNFNN